MSAVFYVLLGALVAFVVLLICVVLERDDDDF